MLIFISYASEDRKIAEDLYNTLKNNNLDIEPWLDRYSLPFDKFEKQIPLHIINCDIVILVITKNYINAVVKKERYLKEEFRLIYSQAEKQNLVMLTCIFSETYLPKKLNKYNYLKLEKQDISSLEQFNNEVINRIKLTSKDIYYFDQLMVKINKQKTWLWWWKWFRKYEIIITSKGLSERFYLNISTFFIYDKIELTNHNELTLIKPYWEWNFLTFNSKNYIILIPVFNKIFPIRAQIDFDPVSCGIANVDFYYRNKRLN